MNNKYIIYDVLKRVFDLISASLLAVSIAPILIFIAICIYREDGSPVIFRQIRVGQFGEKFFIYKFRSMKKGADDLKKSLSKDQYEKYLKEFKLDNDPRITKTGKFLRKTSLDELPQLYNIIIGNLSVVGPRPLLEKEFLFYTESEKKEILSVKPGLTGYWQAYARNNATYESGERQKMELFYVRNRSFIFDLKIIIKTIFSVISQKGAK